MAPLLGGLGAVIGGLPIAILGAVVSWLAYPRHPQAGALERYEAATAGIRVCDVCRLARGDGTPKEGVAYCGRCGAWICPDVPATLRPAGDRGAQARRTGGTRRPALTDAVLRRRARGEGSRRGIGPREST